MGHLKNTIDACRGAFAALAACSALVNVLMLTAPLYMLQVFDRVLTSRSTDTLLVLSLVAGAALLTLALLEGVRSVALVKTSAWLDGRLGGPTLRASVGAALRSGDERSVQSLRDLATFRSFVAGPSVLPLMDAPWTPLFVIVIFFLNPLLGWMAVGGAVTLLALAVANELLTRELQYRSGNVQIKAMQQAEAAVRNADVIEAMGMMANLMRRWKVHNVDATSLQANIGTLSGVIGALSKFVRLTLQIAMLGVGAWLVIANELTAGGMIAGTILLGRALAPVDQAIGAWRGLVAARAAYRRLQSHLADVDDDEEAMPLPKPQGALRCEDVTFRYADEGEPDLRSVNMDLPAGKALGIIGPTASGKTTLARLLVGILKPRLGHVRLDNMDVAKWNALDRGQHVGYLPQDVELFAGTIRQNIARMSDGEPDAVIAAARLAGVHELILRLPKGYETQIGDGSRALAGGQRQRIALARALYGEPSLVVLDEPNSNLDQLGIKSLASAIDEIQRRGITLVIIAHQPSVIDQVDYLLVLGDGAVRMSGPRAEVLAQMAATQPVANAANVEAMRHG